MAGEGQMQGVWVRGEPSTVTIIVGLMPWKVGEMLFPHLGYHSNFWPFRKQLGSVQSSHRIMGGLVTETISEKVSQSLVLSGTHDQGPADSGQGPVVRAERRNPKGNTNFFPYLNI